ncbi:MAG TPA: T9SS type A sorting domain-containing protein [Puia sp.]|nr:T9SS type A sorting domain-containing protein [Puia sp.]
MKKLYSVCAALCAFLSFSFQQNIQAQCSCSGGAVASSVSYLQKLSVTNAGSSTISFPKFDPSIGTLTCVLFQDTISGVTNTVIQNSGSTSTSFQFLLTVANGIAGPGNQINEVFTDTYGPNTLDAAASISYGPDSLFKNVKDSSYAKDTTGYQGKGTVNYVYTLNGGLAALQGGLNYNAQIITNYWGSFRLTYFYCQDPTNTRNHCIHLKATKGSGCVNLQWQSSNLPRNCSYQIDYSKDGNQFSSCGQTSSAQNVTNDTTDYQYKYNVSQTDKNRLYFRIRSTDATGNVTYSPVRWVNLDAQGIAGCNVYPNPARNTATVEFDEMLTGKYSLELVNSNGFSVQRKEVTLAGNNQMTIDVSNLRRGMYFLRMRDETSNQLVVTKVMVQ